MRGLVFNQTLRYREDLPMPALPSGEARIQVLQAGVCSTDLHILKGYMNFTGILGHEFVGKVLESPEEPSWIGQRVVGEINAACQKCFTCLSGTPTHCPHRTVLGIQGRDGAFADSLTLPISNLHPVPETLTDDQATFVEPLAAACEIPQQVRIRPSDRIVVIGDGKLGILCAQVLALSGPFVQLLGKHPAHAAWISKYGIAYAGSPGDIRGQVDIVVEATGNPSGFSLAMQLLRPRGTLVLKSTYKDSLAVNMAGIVIHEIRILGSRCGPFSPAIRLLEHGLVDVHPLIHARYSLSQGLTAMERAAQSGTLKVLLQMG